MATSRGHYSLTRRLLGRMVALLLFFAGANTAGAGDRLELVMFESAACEWCDLWRTEIGPIYGKSEEGHAAPLRVVSIHSAKPADLNAISGIVYTPTFVLWDGKREIGRILGYGGEIQFWGLLGELLKKHKGQAAKPTANSKMLHATPVERTR